MRQDAAPSWSAFDTGVGLVTFEEKFDDGTRKHEIATTSSSELELSTTE